MLWSLPEHFCQIHLKSFFFCPHCSNLSVWSPIPNELLASCRGQRHSWVLETPIEINQPMFKPQKASLSNSHDGSFWCEVTAHPPPSLRGVSKKKEAILNILVASFLFLAVSQDVCVCVCVCVSVCRYEGKRVMLHVNIHVCGCVCGLSVCVYMYRLLSISYFKALNDHFLRLHSHFLPLPSRRQECMGTGRPCSLGQGNWKETFS